MSHIELSVKEWQLVMELLEHEENDLREEIHHTDDHDYKETLKEREASIRELLQRLKTEQKS
jgi:hypothetical protein